MKNKNLSQRVTINLKGLVDDIYSLIGQKPSLIDLVSVELTEGKEYLVYWFAPTDCLVNKYDNFIFEYFDQPESKSLLGVNSDGNDLTYTFHIKSNENTEHEQAEVDFDKQIIKPISLNGNSITDVDGEIVCNKWKDNILEKLPFEFFTFSKISFDVGGIPFTAAIWLGYDSKFEVADHYKSLVYGFLWKHSLLEIAGDLNNRVKIQALRSAISQVMARNMSHNIGSHVLSRMISESQIKELDKLSEDARIDLEKDMKSIPSNPDNKFQYFGPHPTEIKSGDRHDVRARAASFNSYLKSRMDYLADIATGTPTLETPKMLYNEVLSGLDKNRILLDRISGVSDFIYRIKLHDCLNCPDGADCGLKDNKENSTCEYDSEDSKEDILVSIPNDILGSHAFYIIMENIIRNTAKHGKQPKEKVYEFHIEVRQCAADETMYQLEIYDTCEFSNNEGIVFDDKEKQELEKVIKDGSFLNSSFTSIEKLVINQNMRLNESILDPKTNRLRQGAWGLIEMAVSAAYLRKIPIEELDDKKYHIDLKDIDGKGDDYQPKSSYSDSKEKPLNILRAFKKQKVGKNEEEVNHFGYQLFLMKPKELLVVLDENSIAEINDLQRVGSDEDIIRNNVNALRNNGIWVYYDGNRENANCYGLNWFDRAEIYSHELLVTFCDNKIMEKNTFDYLPDRKVMDNDLLNELRKIICCPRSKNISSKCKHFKEHAWGIFIKNELGGRCILITPLSTGAGNFYGFPRPQCKGNFISKFSDHGDDWTDEFRKFPKEVEFLEVVSNTTNLKPILKRACSELSMGKNPNQDKLIYAKLRNGIFAQVVIIDERIQEAAYTLTYSPIKTSKDEKFMDIDYFQMYAANGIYVPSPYVDYGEKNEDGNSEEVFFNLSKTSFSDFHEKFKTVIRNALKEESNGEFKDQEVEVRGEKCGTGKIFKLSRVRYLVIHLGILEKLLSASNNRKSKPEGEQKVIKEYLFGNKNETSGVIEDNGLIPKSRQGKLKVIIVSGRGKPDNLPPEVPFLNFSALAQYSIDTRNKILLTELLSATRKLK